MVVIAWFRKTLPVPWPRIAPAKFLTGALALWLTAKVVFVERIVPRRNTHRAQVNGQWLASLVPASQCVYLVRVKDEGLMFYFGRNAVRLKSFADLPSSAAPAYCILEYYEWQVLKWEENWQMDVLEILGSETVLVRVRR